MVQRAAHKYAVLTPARNEAKSLPRLASALAKQTIPPSLWMILENGSSDDTAQVARGLSQKHSFARLVEVPTEKSAPVRGGPIVRALHFGLEELPGDCTVVMKVDADITPEAQYAERLFAEFDRDPKLGIASGTCYEDRGGVWVQQHMTGAMAWCAARAWRLECLREVLPFTERFGWDSVDIAKARLGGWQTRLFTDLAFRHHRKEGERDGVGAASWINQGRGSYFLGYRPSYVVARAIGRMRDNPNAIMMIWGFVSECIRRGERLPEPAVRELLRNDQRWRYMFSRVKESSGIR